jgi:hypothetical protein
MRARLYPRVLDLIQARKHTLIIQPLAHEHIENNKRDLIQCAPIRHRRENKQQYHQTAQAREALPHGRFHVPRVRPVRQAATRPFLDVFAAPLKHECRITAAYGFNSLCLTREAGGKMCSTNLPRQSSGTTDVIQRWESMVRALKMCEAS